jgi:hypothetical protein
MATPSGKWRSKVGRWIRFAYSRLREPLGYLMILTAIGGGLLQSPKVTLGSLGILCGMIVRLLFEIHSQTEAASKSKRFGSIQDAREEIKVCLHDAFKRDKYIEIQWIGMTMYNVWNTMEQVFDWLAESESAKDVRFRVAMLQSGWLDANSINHDWTGASANQTAQKILSYPQHHSRAINWKFEIERYAHMPAVHGGLINRKYLFLGVCRWEEGTLKAGDRSYEVYSFRDGDESQEKIEVFERWFDFCFSAKPPWYTFP